MTPARLYGTAARLALDFLRSGRAFKEGGPETFGKALRAIDRKIDPADAVSEFRKLINGIETAAVQTGISNRRQYLSGREVPWSEARKSDLVASLDEWFEPVGSGKFRALNYDSPGLSTYHTERAKAYDTMANITKGKRRASLRRSAGLHRSNAAVYEALYRLFGDQVI